MSYTPSVTYVVKQHVSKNVVVNRNIKRDWLWPVSFFTKNFFRITLRYRLTYEWIFMYYGYKKK
nr:MAG TPA: hypothetical protein [Caudoviricetes sp.]